MVIQLKTKFFRIEQSYNCENDALFIYDGPNTKSRLYSRPLCNIKGPENVESSGNTLYLEFRTDKENNDKGFEIEYKAKKMCDYEFNNQKIGWFASPKFPSNYYENANCTYRIKTQRNNAIRISFTDFFLENKANGRCLDYVAVYDVIAGIPRLSKKHCGIGIPPPITSTSNDVLIKFHSDSILNHQGFNATFQTLFTICKRNEFKCQNGRCVSVNLICNQVNDCYDNSDENYCCAGFLCDNERCIKKEERCDTLNQCGDWSDEKHCTDGRPITTRRLTTPTTTTLPPITALVTKTYYPPCPYGEFTCENKQCIDASLRCNGHKDCHDGSDEICSGQCRNMNGQCQHICIDDKNKVTCKCYAGFYLDTDGHSCIDINECSSLPCQEVCDNTYGSYKCACKKGYRLADDGHSCTDFDECKHFGNLCEQDCVNTDGSYECVCFRGYVFHNDISACVDVDECVLDNGGCAEDCDNTIGSYRCTCNKLGYRMVPGKTYCEEINECELGTASCSQICTNTDGGYECSCRNGYRLDHDLHNCLDIDECLVGVPGCWGGCINTFGSYRCQCDTGFRGIMNDTKCQDINECQYKNGGCSNQCINTHGSYYCKCPKGFVARDPHSYTCDDKDECKDLPCDHSCSNTPGSFYCACNVGYKLVNRTKCVDVNECQEKMDGCSYKCINTKGSFICQCPEGFITVGTQCIEALNGTGCKRLKVNMSHILTSQWTNVTDGWSWQVGISVDFLNVVNIPRYRCIGVLVDEKFVLTTGHCLKFGYISIDPSKILLSLGGYQYGHRNSKVNVQAKTIMFHPTLDLALIQMASTTTELKVDAQPLCLPTQDHVDLSIGQKLVTSAWPSKGVERPLRQIMTTIDSYTTCKWDGKFIFRKDSTICVRFSLPQTLRSLPLSGTPLLGMLRGTPPSKKRQRWYLTGVLIYGDGYPGQRATMSTEYHHIGYYKVTTFTDWLKRTIDRTQNQ
ncbi:uncharacterized protein [Clytia hemisphaerica]